MRESQDIFWAFARESESIYLVREAGFKTYRLRVHGPGAEIVTHEFLDLIECVRHQAEIERKLVAEGFEFIWLETEGQGAEHAKGSDVEHGRAAK